eukprot:1571900-Prymnesium_polylepis.2
MPPLVPAPDAFTGFTTIATTAQLRSAMDAAEPGTSLALYLPQGSVLELGGSPVIVPAINMSLVSAGEGATLDAEHRSQVFTPRSGARLHVSALTLANGHSITNGGTMFIQYSRVTLEQKSSIVNSTSMGFGGAIAMDAGSLTLSDGCEIVNSSTLSTTSQQAVWAAP